MRRYILPSLLLLLAGVQSAFAQKVLVVLDNDEVVTYNVSQVKCIMFEEANPDEHEWVDLGLPSGTLWATTNVGAARPQDCGDYFAWGETTPKDGYTWGNYKWMSEGKDDWNWISKYTFADNQTDACWYSGSTFIGDNTRELELADDAAFVHWGSKWRMPSKEQLNELIDPSNTTTVWTTMDGVLGRKITSLKNGNTLFLPATGYFGEAGTGSVGTTGNYWSRTLDTSFSDHAFELFIKQDNIYCYGANRKDGQSIRPVRRDHEYVDLGLPSGTLWATCNVGADSPEEYGDYFAWGETKPKEYYNWETYRFYYGIEGDNVKLTKYLLTTEYSYDGSMDNLEELLPEDDAAQVNWGSNWQMPSQEQQEELLNSDYTTAVFTTQNGVNGYKITSNSNGKSIFLPAAGVVTGSDFDNVGSDGYYWSRTLLWTLFSGGLNYYILSDDYIIRYGPSVRARGHSVRPVRKK